MSDIDVNYNDNINSYTLDDFDDSYKYTNDDLPDYSEDPIDVEDEELFLLVISLLLFY